MAVATGTAIAIAGVAAAGGTVAAAAMNRQDSPEARNYGAETRETLQAKLDLAPQLFASEQEYQPRYNKLAYDEQMAFLLGRPASQTEQSYTDYEMRQVAGTGRTQINAKLGNTVQIPAQYEKVPVTRTKMVETPAQRGFLDVLEKDISPYLRKIKQDDRANEISDIETLGPKSMQALRTANPQAAAIVDSLLEEAGANARGDLGAGERRDIQQAIREAQGARGVGYGPSDTHQEVYGSGIASRELAYNKGLRALGMSDSFYSQPFQQVMGGGSSAGGAGGLLAAAGANNAAAGPRLFDPESAYAADIFGTNFNAQSAAAISARNNRAALMGSLIGGAGAIGGGYLAAGGGGGDGGYGAGVDHSSAMARLGYDPYGTYV